MKLSIKSIKQLLYRSGVCNENGRGAFKLSVDRIEEGYIVWWAFSNDPILKVLSEEGINAEIRPWAEFGGLGNSEVIFVKKVA